MILQLYFPAAACGAGQARGGAGQARGCHDPTGCGGTASSQPGAARGAVGAGRTGRRCRLGARCPYRAGAGPGTPPGPSSGRDGSRGAPPSPSRRRAGAAACRSGAAAFPRAYWRAGCHGNAAFPRQRVARQVRRRRGRALPGEGTAPGCAAVATETVILPSNRAAGSSGGPRPARRSARLGMMCVIFFSCSDMSSRLGRAAAAWARCFAAALGNVFHATAIPSGFHCSFPAHPPRS